MKRNIGLYFFFLWFAFFPGNAKNRYISKIYDGKDLLVSTDSGEYILSAVKENIIKVSFRNQRIYSNKTYAPVITGTLETHLTELNNELVLSTDEIDVHINKFPVSINFVYRGALKLGGLKFETSTDTMIYQNRMKPGEQIYGTGARALPLNRRGYRFQCYNQANYGYGNGADFLNYSIPQIMSSEKYMLLFDNPARAWFDIGNRDVDRFSFESMGGNATVYFFADDSYDKLVSDYVKFTGMQPIPPVWALGNLQSRFGYRSQMQTENVVDSMFQAGYPMDAIILDIFWFGPQVQDGLMGNLSWDSIHWPEPERMIRKFRDKGVKTVLISEPFFTKKSNHYSYLDQHGLFGKNSDGTTMTLPNFYFGEAGLLDIFNPEGGDWLWQRYDALKQQGVEGWWCDLGEPEIHPDSMIHVNGKASEVHGIYGHNWTKVFYDHYRKEYPDERLFVLGRAGYAGSQRFGLVPWSGDVGRTWSGLRAQIPVMLGMGLSGLAYMHSDAGGFASGTKNPELYTRWLQYAVFTPVFRPHSDSHAEPEPIYYADSIQDIVRHYIKLRYAMLPYNYTLAWQNHTSGEPMAKPLFMVYDDPELSANDSIYFWGDNLLVAPVMRSGTGVQKVALPEGTWYDFHTGDMIEGGKTIDVAVTLSDIPVFVKAGSFIPMISPIQSTDDYKTDTLIVHFFTDPERKASHFIMYADDGHTFGAYEKNQYELIDFTYKNGIFTVKSSGYNYPGRPPHRLLKFVVHQPDFEKVKINRKWIKTEIKEKTTSIIVTLPANRTIEIQTR
ncbi:TIM-barrel domain-containing protein [Saccharicrinis sp. FJH2]|uniref:glycoside hydrolase family 31 protein n=1 Tax=Saccharicrinis sp. FJH65 TaxID=3344659 RepID=UPI0035F29A7C